MTSQTPIAPITQDVLTLPRKSAEGGRRNLVGLTRDQLRAVLIEAGTPEGQAKMRVGQIWQWLYHWGLRDFSGMTNLSKEFRALLAEHFSIELPEIVSKQVSVDGTRKYLLRINGGRGALRRGAGIGQIGAHHLGAAGFGMQQAQLGMGLVLDQFGFGKAAGPAVILGQPDDIADREVIGGDDDGGESSAHWMASFRGVARRAAPRRGDRP